MKPVLTILMWLLLLGMGPTGGLNAAEVSSAEALKAISQFEDDFGNAQSQAAIKTIFDFAKKSSAVHISISHETIPWLKANADKDAPETEARNLLLVAYMAGNIKAQLKAGKAVDDPYPGWEQMLITYDQLRKINPEVKIAEVEDLKSKDASGKLRSYATEVLSREKAKPAH